MKKKTAAILLAAALTGALIAGCSGPDHAGSDADMAVDGTGNEENASEAGTDTEKSDEELAAECAALIDRIYVQERTESTDADIEAAKAAWDALTDEQRDLVQGEYADPDYFGRDTGDASADDPLNGDEIGENELLVVSFGTSFNDSRAQDIGGIERTLQEAYPDWSVRRAFTSQIIINHIQARDGEAIDNIDQALARAKENGVRNLVVQPTHLMHGAEYDDLAAAVRASADDFETIRIAEPLLGEVGVDAQTLNADKEAVARALTDQALEEAGYETLLDSGFDSVAFVFLGHGTSHAASVTYSQMQAQLDEMLYTNVFIGTVEGEPEETACDRVIERVRETGFQKVILRPLMIVAGDHAHNDMAGEDEDSWKSMFEADDSFESVDCQIEGLGRIESIEQLYVAHTGAAMEADPDFTGTPAEADLSAENGSDAAEEDADRTAPDSDQTETAPEAASSDASDTGLTSGSGNTEETADTSDAPGSADASDTLADGTYTVKFTTDSSMFLVNEADQDTGTLTVEGGQMTLHVRLASQNVLHLYPGTAEEAGSNDAIVLEPTEENVTNQDGSTGTVYSFDIPVPAIGEEFDCALIGEKGRWSDHKVMVSNPEKVE